MADTTTVKVHTSTRDLLLELGAARRQSADQVIRAALSAMKRDERRAVAAVEARAIKDDPQDRAEIAAIQQDLATLSTWVVAFTSTSARETSFRPPVEIQERRTLVMCDQIATVDVNRLAEPAGFLSLEEMQRVDEALALVLDL